jgi:hypothetical protein
MRATSSFQEAAKRFWKDVDVEHGAAPTEGTLRGYLYKRVFHYNPSGTENFRRRDAVDLASAGLRDAIRRHRDRTWQMNVADPGLLLYAYATSPSVARGPENWTSAPSYLAPSDVPTVAGMVLDMATSPEKRAALSLELNVLIAGEFFIKMLPMNHRAGGSTPEKDFETRCSAARNIAEMLLEWYGTYYASDWEPPTLFHAVAKTFPDLADRIKWRTWGLGEHRRSEVNRLCK